MELFAAIRRDARVEEYSIRELARRHGVHRRTVRQALASAEPPPRKTPSRVAPKLGPYVEVVDAMLVADLDAPRATGLWPVAGAARRRPWGAQNHPSICMP